MSKVRSLLFLVLLSAIIVSCSSDKPKESAKENKESTTKKKLTKLDKDKKELTKLLGQQVKRIDKSLTMLIDTTATANKSLIDSLEVKKAILIEKTAQVNAATKETWKLVKKDATQTLNKTKKEVKALLAPFAETKP